MTSLGKFVMKEMKQFQKDLQKLQQRQLDAFTAACAKEIAARLLTLVIERTPVDNGTLRRGWIAKTQAAAEKAAARPPAAPEVIKFVDNLQITRDRDKISVKIVNVVEYASYVEFGHRTANHKGFVPGRSMMQTSIEDIRSIAPQVLEMKLKKFLEGGFR